MWLSLVLQIENECLTCRNGVAAFNMSYFGKYYLTGPDAQRAADWIFSNDVQKPEGIFIHHKDLDLKELK